jgi:excinuclease ABC subunit B
VEIFPAYEENRAIRVESFGDEIELLSEIDPLRGTLIRKMSHTAIFPASHYVTLQQTRKRAIASIIKELKKRIEYFREENKLIEAQRIEERTNFDLEMIQEIGYCNGIENYSRHLTGRKAGEPPPTLLDYFPEGYLTFIDESHITVPQLNAMYKGDRSRKETLVEYGFRLPSAVDNRPLKFDEFRRKTGKVVYISATPAEYEIRESGNGIVEQIARPTGLMDPEIEVRPARNQVDDLLEEIQVRRERNERILVTTLTKRTAEDLTDYYADLGIPVRYLHSDIKTMERIEIIKELRMGEFEVLIGINLLREGLDIPEVSLVAILDADKEGFLRSGRSLIQTCGRAARNVNGTVIMYADRVTGAMQQAIDETSRRRAVQDDYNREHHIVPQTIQKEISATFLPTEAYLSDAAQKPDRVSETLARYHATDNLDDIIASLEKEMRAAAEELEFEKAAEIRDEIEALKKRMLFEL